MTNISEIEMYLGSCANCSSRDLEEFLDLGHQPNGNHFLRREDLSEEVIFPFVMCVCRSCWQVQLREFPSPELMFSDHPYITGVNKPIVDHFNTFAGELLGKYNLKRGDLVLDIGANDGTLLSIFKDNGLCVIGVDPGKKSGALCRGGGILVCEVFWSSLIADAMATLNIRPDIITATAVLYHIENIHDFIVGIRSIMSTETIFVAQCVYMKDVIEHVQFDHFYHEHTLMHAVAPLERVFRQHGMRIIDVDFSDVHGGSFVIVAVLMESGRITSPSVAAAISAERAAGLEKIDTYRKFASRVFEIRDELLSLLRKIKGEGKRVFALGAPLKGSTLLNFCGISMELVELATEVNDFKIGKVIPGVHIPIVDENLMEEEPDYYLVLSWTFLDFFREKYSGFLARGGGFIVPHPTVRIIRECGEID